jgi:hypothetical protein
MSLRINPTTPPLVCNNQSNISFALPSFGIAYLSDAKTWDGGMFSTDGQTAFVHQFFDITVAQGIA